MKKSNKNKTQTPGLDSTVYYAKITTQEDGYLVEFPELPGCLTEGATFDEAIENAREALSGWLLVAIKNEDEFKAPVRRRGHIHYAVAPDIDVSIPLLLLWARKRRGLTQAAVAKRIGVTQQAYRKLEIPGKSNPTLRTISRLIKALELPQNLISTLEP